MVESLALKMLEREGEWIQGLRSEAVFRRAANLNLTRQLIAWVL